MVIRLNIFSSNFIIALEVPLLSGLKVTSVIANNMFKFLTLNLILDLLHVAYPKAAFLDLYTLLYYINDLAQVSEVILNSIVIPTISETEVVAAIKILKNTSAGHDEVPPHILKQNVQLFIKPLTHLVNSSIKNDIFPDELKIAKVVPIFKANDKQNIENYRPISVLSVFSKIIEKVMYYQNFARMLQWILLQNIIYCIKISI